MKKYLQLVGITGIMLSGLTAVAASFEKPEDNSIVDIIKQYSNLTNRDVQKIKLIKLGMLQEPAAGSLGATAVAAGGYGGYKAHELAGAIGSKAQEYAQGFYKQPELKPGEVANPGFIKSYVPESILNLVSNKWAWAIAGAVGIGIGSYKFLYPRLERSILNRVKIFVDMCENLDVYSFNYALQHAQYPGDLAKMGSEPANQSGAKYKSEWLPVNAAWITNNIARAKGLKNLLEQAGVAVKLLAQLPSTKEVENLRGRVSTIIRHLKNNEALIEWSAQQEQNERDKLDAQQVGAQQRVAQLGLVKAQTDAEKEKTSALRWAKVMGIINAVPYAAKKTAETLAYIYDNKAKIAGGVVAIYFLPQALRTAWWMQSLAAKDAAEQLAAARQKAAAALAAQGK